MKLVIHTQHRENYAAHTWDGEGECPEYWKYKGGDVYVLNGVTPDQAADPMWRLRAISHLRGRIESRSHHFEEYILEWSLMDDQEVDWNHWEHPVFIRRDPKTGWFGARQRQEYPPGEATWLMGQAGEKIDRVWIDDDAAA